MRMTSRIAVEVRCSTAVVECADLTVPAEGIKGSVNRAQADRGQCFAYFLMDPFCGRMLIGLFQYAQYGRSLFGLSYHLLHPKRKPNSRYGTYPG